MADEHEHRWFIEVDDLGGYQVRLPQPGRKSHMEEVVPKSRVEAAERRVTELEQKVRYLEKELRYLVYGEEDDS